MNTLLYLCYGQGAHVQETLFSLLSAFRFLKSSRVQAYRFLIYTDNAAAFDKLPVTIECLDAARLREWLGPHGYMPRRKIMTVIDALTKYPEVIAFIDSDTWFIRSPDELFGRISPGRSCLHVAEGPLMITFTRNRWRDLAKILACARLVDGQGRAVNIPPDSTMWNSGVIGLDPSDAHLLRDSLYLIDQLWSQFWSQLQRISTVEQLMLGHVLNSYTELQPVDDIVFHYWSQDLRRPFRERLPSLLSDTEHLPLIERACQTYSHRPRPNWLRRRKLSLKRSLQDLGFLGAELQKSG